MNGCASLGFKTYKEYLSSELWFEKAEWIKQVFNFTCQICGCHENLQVHHLNYNSVGNEKQEDVTVLCKRCHEKIHKEEAKNGRKED